MNECIICEISGTKTRLFDAITNEGITLICEKCSFDEGIPIIKKPTTYQLKESESKTTQKLSISPTNSFKKSPTFSNEKETTTQRLTRISGINPIKKQEKTEQEKKQETTLKDILEKNISKKPIQLKPRKNLIDNFHWIIMRARRKKYLTQEQLAKEIAESETAIKMAEKGILPEDDHKLLNKLENYLKIKLNKNKTSELTKPNQISDSIQSPARAIDFDPVTVKNITISDLKEIKKQKLIQEQLEKNKESKTLEKPLPNTQEKTELSQEEIENIIFK